MSYQPFIDHIRSELSTTNTELKLVDAPYALDDGEEDTVENQYSGWFDDSNRRLVVATKKPDDQWLGVLAHEFGHYHQWKEKFDFGEYDESMEYLIAYTQGADISMHYAFQCVDHILHAELDAERRALAYIDEWDLPIDRDRYISASMAYLLNYYMIAHTRQWPKKRVYQTEGLIQCLEFEDLPDCIDSIPNYTQYEKLFYVFGNFDPPRKKYTGPDMVCSV
jgi:hypothetical protein